MTVFAGSARVLAVETDGRPRVIVLGAPADGAPADGALAHGALAAPIIADWAIPFRYTPETGDLLQVLGQHGRFWVTGVVHGRGRSQLAFRGDTAVHASGALRLGADGGVRLEAPTVHVEAAGLETDADTIVSHADAQDTTVHGQLDERAGAVERQIDGDDDRTAGRHATVAERVVKIDGDLLRLS
ncbi:MAG: hypothetical protein H6835_07840 [Planctomycetes bacterium]|nr:hypothetical protein [Planctomycetota bacterium]